MARRIVLAYSGSEAATRAIPWLADHVQADVVALTLDIGQSAELEAVRGRALSAGAIRAHVLDCTEPFAREHILPALRAGALEQGRYPLLAPLAWPLVAKALVEIAAIEETTLVAHCATDPAFEVAITALAPGLDVRSPRAAGGGASPPPAALALPTSPHDSLWGRVRHALEDDAHDARAGAEASEMAIELTFEEGMPSAINGVPMTLLELVESLSIIAGPLGVGRIHRAAGSPDGAAALCYDAPAAVLLHAAHAALQSAVLPRALAAVSREVAAAYTSLIQDGRWWSTTREALDAFVDQIERAVRGEVRLTLLHGRHGVAAVRPSAPPTSAAMPARPLVTHA